MADDVQGPVSEPKRWQNALEMWGEFILLGMVASFFAYLAIKSMNWPLGAALMPRIAVALGVPFLIARLVVLVRSKVAHQGEIMDTGFRIGHDPKGELQRFIRICTFIVGLYLAIWAVGFHIALPLGVAFYLYRYGKVGWLWSTVGGLFFLGLIIGLYDNVLHVAWHEPLINVFGD
jgi:hypothetical protein